MKTRGLVIMLVCFSLFSGVSCNNDSLVSECNLITKGIGLEVNGVTYQYSVVKNNGPQGDKVIDWTSFDIAFGFSVKNLTNGSYTFSVRGITNKGAVMYSGSTTRFITQENQDDIIIVLYPQFDNENQDSTLTINLLTSASENNTACCYVKSMSAGSSSERISLSKCGTGFSSASTHLAPGYYEVTTYVFQDGVEVGGNYSIVSIPTGYSKTLNVSISPRSFEGFVDIANTSSLTVKKEDVVTFGWVGENSNASSNGYWIVGNKVVEDNALYYTLPTTTEGTYTVEYYRDSIHKTCTVTVGSEEKKADVYIMNFRSKTFGSNQLVVGYKDKTTGKVFSTSKVNMVVGDNFNPSDYEALNLEPILSNTCVGATFIEAPSGSTITSKYGQLATKQNTTVTQMIVHGDLSGSILANKFPNLEILILDGPSIISTSALQNLTSLKTVYIIPPTTGTGKTTISSNVFTGSGVTKVCVVGESTKISMSASWTSGSTLTKSDFVYNFKLPL